MSTMFLSLIVEISKALKCPPVTQYSHLVSRERHLIQVGRRGDRAYAHAHSMANFKATFFMICVGHDSVVIIETHFGLNGPVIESQWGGRDFLNLSRQALWSNQPPVQWAQGLFLGRGINHPPPSRAGIKEGVELYLCSLSGSSEPVLE